MFTSDESVETPAANRSKASGRASGASWSRESETQKYSDKVSGKKVTCHSPSPVTFIRNAVIWRPATAIWRYWLGTGTKSAYITSDQPGSGRWGLLNRTNKTTHTWLEMRRGVAEFDGGSWLMTFSILYGYLFESTPNIMMKCEEKLSLIVTIFKFRNMYG